MLVLPIKKKWFDMILSGEKKEEYREIKPYYDSRLLWYFEYSNGIEKRVIFRNGYSRNSPQLKCKCTLDKGFGKPEWGAEEGKEYYILKIIEAINNESEADKLFKELGYQEISKVNNSIYYSKANGVKLTFYEEEKGFIKTFGNTKMIIQFNELKAINMKCKELGWSDE